jgi:hypothetical protein
MDYQHNKTQTSNTNFRTWKKGKTWLYGCSVAAALVGGVMFSAQTVNAETSIESVQVEVETPTTENSEAEISHVESLAYETTTLSESSESENIESSEVTSELPILASSSETAEISESEISSRASEVSEVLQTPSSSSASVISADTSNAAEFSNSKPEASESVSTIRNH